ncbi:hypothetical protein M011DRAFT_484477 [Sporormia fimetaria CBS 119925]|uniref:Nuclear fusion protein KAR5 n=1 Tax=Sporormia fimetaria CBS 119925 TaxID=1340428 RepID=A0A6A6VGR0_9PLEO|nr:hypothetical protein M011DRAFT_484477 [Sporormia fimetaria CBS 119925]
MRSSLLSLICVALVQFSQGKQALNQWRTEIPEHAEKKDLASVLQDPPLQQHERLSEALQIIYPLQSGPRCHYQAALNLLNDCKFLENANPDAKDHSEARLDQLETVYAARLAVCELLSANVDIPPDCKVVTPSREACVKKRSGYSAWFSRQDEPKEDRLCYPETLHPKPFKRCMKALFSQNQSWMSYSNARQNAVVMCHASRDVIEKDRSLSFYKNLGEAVNFMASTLERQNEQIKSWLTEQDALVSKILSTSEQALQEAQESFSTFESLKGAFRSFAGMMARTTESYSETVEESLQRTKAIVEQHNQEIQQYQDTLAEASVQHAFAQRSELESNHKAAVDALRSYHYAALETLQMNHEAAISKVHHVAHTVDELQEKVDASTNSIGFINEGLIKVNQTVERLDAATESLPDMINMLTTVGGVFSSPQLFFAAAVCILGLWKANGPIAGYVIATGGLCYFLSLLKIPEAASNCWHHLTALLRTYPLHCAIYGFAIVVILSYLIHVRLRSAYLHTIRDEHGHKGVLPSIEAPSYPSTPHRGRGVLGTKPYSYFTD